MQGRLKRNDKTKTKDRKGSRKEIKKGREKRQYKEKLHYCYYTILMLWSKKQAQAMLSFHNVKCVFEAMC